MEKYDVIWDQKAPKKVEPSAQISARIIALNEPAINGIGKFDKLCLGVSADKKKVFIKPYSKDMGNDVFQYEASIAQDKCSIKKCAQFIAGLDLELPAKQRLKCKVTIDDNMLILDLGK